MLAVKRLASFVLDALFFLTITILIDFIFSQTKSPPAQLTVVIAFFSSLILPILILGRPISYTILRLFTENHNLIVSRSKLIFKYIINYLFVSSEFLSIVSFFTEFFNNYTYIRSGLMFPIKIAGVLVLLNALCFIVTFGERNLIDELLKINYITSGVPKKSSVGLVRLSYLLSISIILPTLVEFKLSQMFSFQGLFEDVKNINKDYFPIEVFGNYIEANLISVKIENTNRIISPSEPSSYFLNRYLTQRQIVASINEKVSKDQNERKKLCYLLLRYSYSNPWTFKEALQTKIVLVNMKRVNPFASIQTTYTYYYDDKMPIYQFYGGYNSDSLSNFYKNLDKDYFNIYISKLSQALGLPKDTILKYRNEEGTIVLPEGLDVKVKNIKIPLEIKGSISGTAFTAVPFEKVDPVQFLKLNFPPSDITFSLDFIGELLGSTEVEDEMFYLKSNYVLSR